MRFYTDEAIETLYDDYRRLLSRRMRLQERFITYSFKNNLAREYATHGFWRRISSIVRCIHNTFEAIPPDLDVLPEPESVRDTEIQIQALFINVFGCLDNLAWVWVLEEGVTKKNSNPISNKSVGLGASYKQVRNSLGPHLGSYLKSIDGWFVYLENYRHALAHRIPLYIPPFSIDPKNEAKYHSLERVLMSSQSDAPERSKLEEELNALKHFKPLIVHSFSEKSEPVPFHRQMLIDLNTIEAITDKLFADINRVPL